MPSAFLNQTFSAEQPSETLDKLYLMFSLCEAPSCPKSANTVSECSLDGA